MRLKYREYVTREKKKLGIVGEVHTYTPSESEFVIDKMQEYDSVGVEGLPNRPLGLSFMYNFHVKVATHGTKRSVDNHPRKRIKSLGKEKIALEEGYVFPIRCRLALGFLSIIALPSLPILAGLSYLGGKFSVIDEAMEEPIDRPAFLTKAFGWVMADSYNSDTYMANKIVDSFQTRENLLVLCGKEHVKGLEDKVSSKISLERTK